MHVPAGKTILVTGIVQGVGFRPFVYGLADRHGVRGDVRNTSEGVRIRAFGEREAIERFAADLERRPPPLAAIQAVRTEDVPYEDRDAFVIRPSEDAAARQVAVTPDAALCADCRRELLDPADRRYRYPFISCTHCGPRYSVLLDVPYDRPNITLKNFPLCDACRAEYEDPTDRRHHAQTDCCPACGPQLWCAGSNGQRLADDPIGAAARALARGQIVAVKGLGGFHLACDARNNDAVERLRARKDREEKPFAVMVRDKDAAQQLAELPAYAGELFASPASPIVIARKVHPEGLAPAVAPGNDFYGLMVPYTPLHVLLLAEGPDALVMTSANRTDEPIAIDNHEALERLDGIADAFLLHDRPISIRVDDSVVLATGGGPTLLRRARGYVPAGIETGRNVDGIAGFGPMLKNTLAVGRGTVVYPGQHVGDLNNRLALDMFDEVYAHLQAILGVSVRRIACDLHPDYPTTRLAAETGLETVAVQHHHAHLAGLMAEHRVYDRGIGLAFDGTGYGPDDQLWGGEVFTFDPASFERAFHLEYVPLPGGEQAIREPWRMALAHLVHHRLDWTPFVENELADRAPQAASVVKLLQSDIPRVHTSGMGRLFDAVASLTGLCHTASYEGQAPMRLEGALTDAGEPYGFELEGGRIRTGRLVADVLRDVEAGVAPGIISGRFHNTIVALALEACRRVRAAEGLTRVFLSGGCFVNAFLRTRIPGRLAADGFEVFAHRLLPPNDGGVSTGQVLVAAAREG